MMSHRPVCKLPLLSWVDWLCVGIIALGAGILRALPWRNFLGRTGEYLFYGPDSYDHLRRITLGLSSFPAVPAFDSYAGYPIGTGQIWSPLFDYLLTLAAFCCGATAAQPLPAYTLGFWLPPVLASATIMLVFMVAHRLAGKAAGMIAAAVLTLLPGHILYSLVSELDHHVAEPLVCLVIIIVLLRADEQVHRGRSGWLIALPVAGAFLLAIMIWRGSVIFWGVALLALLGQSLGAAAAGRLSRCHTLLARDCCWLAAMMLVPICLLNVWGSAGGMNFGIVSWFHVGLLGLAGLFFWGLVHGLGGGRRLLLLLLAALAAGGAVLLLPAGRQLGREFLAGLAVIGGADPWLDSISELRPMLYPEGVLNLWHATETLSFLYWLLPVALFIALRRWLKGGSADFPLLLFVVWGALFWFLPLLRERYVHLTAVVLAVGAGVMVAEITDWLSARSKQVPLIVVPLLLITFCLAPAVQFLWRVPTLGLTPAERLDLPDALAWLRQNTPPTSHYTHPLQVPEYGVLAEWGLGAYISCQAERPTVATNFGWETHGLFESAAFLVQSDPLLATLLLNENRVRYLLLSDVTGQLPKFRAIAEYGMDKKGIKPLAPFVPLATMYYRLYIQDGSAYAVQGVEHAALGRYQLIYESVGQAPEQVKGTISHYKIFEYVPGAELAGKANPESFVTVELPLRTRNGRRFQYRDRVAVKTDGTFSVRVPYATSGGASDVSAEGDYRLKVNGRTRSIQVLPGEVVAGARKQVVL